MAGGELAPDLLREVVPVPEGDGAIFVWVDGWVCGGEIGSGEGKGGRAVDSAFDAGSNGREIGRNHNHHHHHHHRHRHPRSCMHMDASDAPPDALAGQGPLEQLLLQGHLPGRDEPHRQVEPPLAEPHHLS